MSTLKTVNIQHPSASTPAITLDSAGAMTGSFPYPNRNLLYNGAMQIHQRSTSVASVTPTSVAYYTADRWQFEGSNIGTYTLTIENDAPTSNGFAKSFKVLCTTPDSAPASGDYLRFNQRLEGLDLQRIQKGTASAQPLTLSFWVKSNVTGNYIAMLEDTTNSRFVGAPYSITQSGVWQYKSVTFPSDAVGALANTNGTALIAEWWLAGGSGFNSGNQANLPLSWVTSNFSNGSAAAGQVNFAGSTNNYWQITGVQLEIGSVATPFEFKSYGQELLECQRYYWRSLPSTNWSSYGIGRANSSTALYCFFMFPITMRSSPSSVEYSNLCAHHPGAVAYNFTALTIPEGSSVSADCVATVASGLTTGSYYHVSNNGNANGYIAFSAEL